MDQGQIEQNINLANQYVEAINTQNLGILDEIFHPKFQIRQQPETPSLRYTRDKAEIEEIKKIVSGYITAFPDMHIKIIDTLASDNSAVVYWKASMTHMGDFFGLKPTNKNLEVDDYYLTYDTLKLFSEIGHAIVAEGDEGTVSEYFQILMNLDLN
ncbi:MAG: ester cyclase [Candidatus Kariarchaeaceae archaeon]|jgi:predicted ester cyclase